MILTFQGLKAKGKNWLKSELIQFIAYMSEWEKVKFWEWNKTSFCRLGEPWLKVRKLNKLVKSDGLDVWSQSLLGPARWEAFQDMSIQEETPEQSQDMLEGLHLSS